MYPWIHNAMSILFEGNQVFVGSEWKINLDTVPKINYYEIKELEQHGGNQYGTYETQYDNYRTVNFNDTMKWDIDTFLYKKKKRFSRKAVRRSIKGN